MRLSVHLMVRDAAPALGRLLRPLRGLPAEVCFVDTGSTDGTPNRLVRLAGELGLGCSGVAVSPASRPDLYLRDSSQSFRRRVPGTFAGGMLLRDWAAARNLGLDLCRGDYVLKLDADDEVLDPGNLLPSLLFLDANPQQDFLLCPREVMEGGKIGRLELQARIWRSRPEIKFREVCHENVDWARRASPECNYTIVPSGLLVRDHRDLPRDPLRNLKVLLREYERLEAAGERPSAHLAIYLAHEAARYMPELSLEVVEGWLSGLPLPREDAGWLEMIKAECWATTGEEERAEACLAEASRLGWPRAGLLLCLQRASRGEPGWRGDLEAALDAARGCYHPRGARRADVERAMELLQKGDR